MPCQMWSFPGGSVVKNLPANARDTRDMGLIPGLGSPVFNLEKYCLISMNPGGLESAKCYLCEREMLNIWGNSTCVLFKLPCWSPNSQGDGIRRWGPWEVIRLRWDHDGGASQDGTSACLRRERDRDISLSATWGYCETFVCQPGRKPRQELNLPAPWFGLLRTVRHKFLLFKPPRIWYFVMVAWGAD